MPKKSDLTSCDYKTLRIMCGFTQDEAMIFHKVQNKSTIKRWENGYSRVSELAANKILELNEKLQWSIDQAVDRYKENAKKDDIVVLVSYSENCKHFIANIGDLPINVHTMLIQRTYLALKSVGAEVSIVEFSPQDYFSYMGANNLTDSQETRARWAVDYYKKCTLE